MKKMQLNRKLKTKLDKNHLVNSGKMHSSSLGHTLQAPAKKLEMAFKRDALNRRLQLRPRTSELERRKILNPDHDRSKIDTSLVRGVRAWCSSVVFERGVRAWCSSVVFEREARNCSKHISHILLAIK